MRIEGLRHERLSRALRHLLITVALTYGCDRNPSVVFIGDVVHDDETSEEMPTDSLDLGYDDSIPPLDAIEEQDGYEDFYEDIFSDVAQDSEIPTMQKWAMRFGGDLTDEGLSLAQCLDGDFIASGHTRSFGAGGNDFWLLRLDAYGSLIWQKSFGRLFEDRPEAVVEIPETGFLVAGSSRHFDSSDFGWDIQLLRLNGEGDILWQKGYDFEYEDHAVQAYSTPDGGFVIVASSASLTYPGMEGALVFKIDETGTVQWQRFYEGIGVVQSASATTDGGAVAAGSVSRQIFLIRLDPGGIAAWGKRYNAEYDTSVGAVCVTQENRYVIAGEVVLNDGGRDALFMSLDDSGNVVWARQWIGAGQDEIYSVAKDYDTGFMAAGAISSFGLTGNGGFWVASFHGDGEIRWQKTYGIERGVGSAWSVLQTSDGGIATTGGLTIDSDRDLWILKMDGYGNMSDTCPVGIGLDSYLIPSTLPVESVDLSPVYSDIELTVYTSNFETEVTSSVAEVDCSN